LFLRRKRKLRVDLGELEDKRETLASFLRSKLKVDVTLKSSKLVLESGNLPSKELKRSVNKFIYKQHLMKEFWVALDGDIVRINKFGHSNTREKGKKRGTQPSIIKHGW